MLIRRKENTVMNSEVPSHSFNNLITLPFIRLMKLMNSYQIFAIGHLLSAIPDGRLLFVHRPGVFVHIISPHQTEPVSPLPSFSQSPSLSLPSHFLFRKKKKNPQIKINPNPQIDLHRHLPLNSTGAVHLLRHRWSLLSFTLSSRPYQYKRRG